MISLRVLSLLVLGVLGCVWGCAEPPAPLQPGWIVDGAGVLVDEEEVTLTELLVGFNERTSVEVAGVTVADLGERLIEDYTYRLVREWGVGREGVNNGALILVTLKERRVHLEVGTGMAWLVTDSVAQSIVDAMIPFFRNEDYFMGLRTGFERLIALNAGVSWDIAYYSLEEVRQGSTAALGRIVTFEAEVTGLADGVAEVTVPDGDAVRLLLTPSTDPTQLDTDALLVFIARVKEVEPLVLCLLGFEGIEG